MKGWFVYFYEGKLFVETAFSNHPKAEILFEKCLFPFYCFRVVNLVNGVLLSGLDGDLANSWCFQGIRLNDELDVRQFVDYAVESGVVLPDNVDIKLEFEFLRTSV